MDSDIHENDEREVYQVSEKIINFKIILQLAAYFQDWLGD